MHSKAHLEKFQKLNSTFIDRVIQAAAFLLNMVLCFYLLSVWLCHSAFSLHDEELTHYYPIFMYRVGQPYSLARLECICCLQVSEKLLTFQTILREGPQEPWECPL